MAEVDGVGKKIVDLAEAMPADKYGWRPAPGVRSISEVYMHIVGGNSDIPSLHRREAAWRASSGEWRNP